MVCSDHHLPRKAQKHTVKNGKRQAPPTEQADWTLAATAATRRERTTKNWWVRSRTYEQRKQTKEREIRCAPWSSRNNPQLHDVADSASGYRPTIFTVKNTQ
jgi:hypothetical protein